MVKNTNLAAGSAIAAVQLESSTSLETSVIQNSADVEITIDEPTANSEVITSDSNAKATAKVQVQGWDTTQKTAIENTINAELEKNTEITSADISQENITINYLAPAKLFGFIPMYLKLRITADADANVKVKFPTA